MDRSQQARVEARMKTDRSCLRADECEQGWSPENDLVKISRYQEMYALELKANLTFVSKL